MYAIIETGGKQYRVEKGDVIDVELLKTENQEKVEFTNVLFFHNGSAPLVGAPYVQKTTVIGEILGTSKGPKTVAFKYKRRKGIRRKVGHRQHYSRVKITEITG